MGRWSCMLPFTLTSIYAAEIREDPFEKLMVRAAF